MYFKRRFGIIQMGYGYDANVNSPDLLFRRYEDYIDFAFITGAGTIEVLPPMFFSSYSIYLKSPGNEIPATYFIYVFEWTFWLTLLMCIILLIAFIYLYKLLNNLSWHTFISITLNSFGISSENLTNNLKSFEFGILVFSVFAFVVGSSFSCFLIANLTIHKHYLPFQNFHELINQNEYGICFNQIGYAAPSINHIILHQPNKVRFCSQSNSELLGNAPNYHREICKSDKTAYIIPNRRYIVEETISAM